MENKPTIFLITDGQLVEESFLEDIHSILSSGEVSNLYGKAEDFEEVSDDSASYRLKSRLIYNLNFVK